MQSLICLDSKWTIFYGVCLSSVTNLYQEVKIPAKTENESGETVSKCDKYLQELRETTYLIKIVTALVVGEIAAS